MGHYVLAKSSDYIPLRDLTGSMLPVGPFPYHIRDERNHFRPDYRASTPILPRNFKSLPVESQDEIAKNRFGYVRDNTAIYGQYLWREVFTGETLHEGARPVTINPEGNFYQYVPDIARRVYDDEDKFLGVAHTEIKTRKAGGKFFLSGKQLAAYCDVTRVGNFELQPILSLDLVVMTFGKKRIGSSQKRVSANGKSYRTCDEWPFSKMTGNELTYHLSQNVLEAVSMPLNLYLHLFRTSFEANAMSVNMRQRSPIIDSDVQTVRSHYTDLINGTIDVKSLQEFDQQRFNRRARRFGFKSSDKLVDLCLDGLYVRRYMMRDGLFAAHGDKNEFAVKPFPVTEYHMPHEEQTRWMKHLRENYSLIMRQSGLADYSQEVKVEDKPLDEDTPF